MLGSNKVRATPSSIYHSRAVGGKFRAASGLHSSRTASRPASGSVKVGSFKTRCLRSALKQPTGRSSACPPGHQHLKTRTKAQARRLEPSKELHLPVTITVSGWPLLENNHSPRAERSGFPPNGQPNHECNWRRPLIYILATRGSRVSTHRATPKHQHDYFCGFASCRQVVGSSGRRPNKTNTHTKWLSASVAAISRGQLKREQRR